MFFKYKSCHALRVFGDDEFHPYKNIQPGAEPAAESPTDDTKNAHGGSKTLAVN